MFAYLMVLVALMNDPAQQAAAPRVWAGDEVTFLTRPQPEFPTGARSNRGEVGLICTVKAGGTFSNCLIESETPRGNGFGRAAILAVQRASRIEMREDGPLEGDRVRASIRFWNGQ